MASHYLGATVAMLLGNVIAQAYVIRDSLDERYYRPENAEATFYDNAVQVRTWKSQHLGALHMLLGAPGYATFEWSARAEKVSFPSGGAFFLDNDALFGMVAGILNVKINSTVTQLKSGDSFWVAAGSVVEALWTLPPHTAKMMMVGSDWEPSFVSAEKVPIFGYHYVNPDDSGTMLEIDAAQVRLHLLDQQPQEVDPHIAGGSCAEEHCGREKHWTSQGKGDPEVLIDYWTPYQFLHPHHHPCGAVYIPINGSLCFQENCSEEDLLKSAEVRWVRPGFFYEFEHVGNWHLAMFVLNLGCGGSFVPQAKPREPYTAYFEQIHATYRWSPHNHAPEFIFGCTSPPLEVDFSSSISTHNAKAGCGNLFLQSELVQPPAVALAQPARTDGKYMIMMVDPDCGMNGSWPIVRAPGHQAPCRHWTVGNLPGSAFSLGAQASFDALGDTLTGWLPSPKPSCGSHRYGICVLEQTDHLKFDESDYCVNGGPCAFHFNTTAFMVKYQLKVLACNLLVVQHIDHSEAHGCPASPTPTSSESAHFV